MSFKIRGVGWKVGGLGLALLVSGKAGVLQAAPPAGRSETQAASSQVVPASAVSLSVIETLIEDTLEDGTVSLEERNLIIGQSQRRLNAAEVAEVEARLTTLPTQRATITSVMRRTPTTNLYSADDANATTADDHCKVCCDEPGCGGWFDNMYYFGAVDGWAGPIDDVDGNNFGFRLGFNMGVPLSECRSIGAQFGMSYGMYNFHGRDSGSERSSVEDQLFFTAGIFKRADLCKPCPDRICWGVVYDQLVTDNLGEDGWEVGLGQVRWQIGYAIDRVNEVGVMASIHVKRDQVGGDSNNADGVHALDQGSLYWHHRWCWGADTTSYFGIAENPGDLVFGARGEVPISNCVSMFGNAQYIHPSTGPGDNADNWAEEMWNISVGVMYYPGGNATSKTVAGRRWMPLLPVADNGSFAIDVLPGNL